MSKCSGLFLSLLLVMICLWINICRYPAVWVMMNGNSAFTLTETSQNSNKTTEPSQKNDEFSQNSIAPINENSMNIIPVSNTELKEDLSNNQLNNSLQVNQSTPQRNVEYSGYQKPAQLANKEYFHNASLTQPVQENEKPEGQNSSNETTEPNPQSDKSSSTIYRSSFQETSVLSDKNENSFIDSNASRKIRCYSLYQAVGSAETKPMLFETPNYSNETFSQIVPCSGSKNF
ncbi:MAG: hypothetical protein Q4C95_04305 [Planctomycetia bacterium]|nr:hypothetical protein [Planctomycetia bacterium]